MAGRIKRRTTTAAVVDHLQRADDFLTVRELMACTGENLNRVTAALAWLKRAGAVDAMECDGRLYWYPTPENDRRCRTIEELVDRPIRRNRKRKMVAGLASGTKKP